MEDASSLLSTQASCVQVWRYTTQCRTQDQDRVAVESPLEMRLAASGEAPRSVAVTMRTPGDDIALTAGFLFAEGVIRGLEDILHIGYDVRVANVVTVVLREHAAAAALRLDRPFPVSSSCGACGKRSLDALQMPRGIERLPEDVLVDRNQVGSLPDLLRSEQAIFESTGGLHAAGLLDDGALVAVCEDVGRHNAVDKAIGCRIMQQCGAPMASMLVVSGRVSFELVQKALMAGIPVLIAVGAPSSLAVELAQRYGMTLIGFARRERFNVYAGANRLR